MFDFLTGGLTAFLTEWSLYIAAAVCIAAAIAAFIYVPVFGHWIAAVLVGIALVLIAYTVGYTARGNLDNSGAIQAQLDEANRELAATQKVTADFNKTQAIADAAAAAQQDKINVYEQTLKAAPETGGCGLTDDDLGSLSNIGPGGPPVAPRPAHVVRPAGKSAGAR